MTPSEWYGEIMLKLGELKGTVDGIEKQVDIIDKRLQYHIDHHPTSRSNGRRTYIIEAGKLGGAGVLGAALVQVLSMVLV